VKNERLLFAADDVPEGLVEGLETIKTADGLAQAVTPILEQAETVREDVDRRRSACDEQREKFRTYCEKNVADVKLRSSIVDGLRYKRDYTAYLEWQDKSRERLERVISVSEEERQSHCAHLEHMLNHMILHLQDVCTGLGELAAKTRIKIGETTKDIFQIQVPPWQDAAARTSIRDYLNALTAELDRADEGEEPEVKSRASWKKSCGPSQCCAVFSAIRLSKSVAARRRVAILSQNGLFPGKNRINGLAVKCGARTWPFSWVA